MDFEQRITALMKEAMKAKDKPRLEALRALKSVILTERTKDGSGLTEDRAVQAIASYRKKMAGAIEQYREAGRDDMVAAAETEVAVADELLPQKLTDDELIALIDAQIEASGATGPGDMGKVMGPVMKQVTGCADGNHVRTLVMQRLGANG